MYRTVPVETNPPIDPHQLSNMLLLTQSRTGVRVEFIRDKWSKSEGLVTGVTVSGDGTATLTVEAVEALEYVPDEEDDEETEDTEEEEEESDE